MHVEIMETFALKTLSLTIRPHMRVHAFFRLMRLIPQSHAKATVTIVSGLSRRPTDRVLASCCRRNIEMPEIFIPARAEIEALKEGDLAPDCFGNWRRITKIYARGADVNGKAYVCYYTEFGPTSSISNSLKEGEINRTVALTGKFTSHELDILEKRLCAGTVTL
jgi:hypothetical protein